MKEEKTRLEDIEGFKDLSKDEQDYFRVMQGEAEYRMSHIHSPGKLEITLEMIAWTTYIIYSIYNKTIDILTISAVTLLLSDIIYLIEKHFEK